MAEITLYGLTTCPYCKRAIKFLQQNGVNFDIVFLDELEERERKEIIMKIYEICGDYAVPLIVKGDRYVLGFDEEEIQELLVD